MEISYRLKLSHIGSCLTAVDIIKEIYDIKKPDEKFVLSSGHAHLAHLVVMRWDMEGQIDMLKKYGIHCDRNAGCDVSSGSLGHGIGIALGMALSDRNNNVYCLISDGELSEGSVWEAFRIMNETALVDSSGNKTHNLKVYVNINKFGAYKEIKNILDLERAALEILPFNTWRPYLTDMNEYPPFLRGQLAHYKVLNKKEYEELMKLLK